MEKLMKLDEEQLVKQIKLDREAEHKKIEKLMIAHKSREMELLGAQKK